MNGYNFTERVRRVLQGAREEALALGHEYVGTEHMLLALCNGGGVAEATLTNLGLDSTRVRDETLKFVKPGTFDGTRTESADVGGIMAAIKDSIFLGGISRSGPDLPYTSRAKKVLELAISEARHLNHSYVGTEHLLLGLIAEGRGIAAQVLTSMGMTLIGLRHEVVRLLGTDRASHTEGPESRSQSAVEERSAAITLVVEHPDGRIEAKKFKAANDAVRFLNGLEY